MEEVFAILILIMSVVIHEVCHGYAAEALGDKTARYAGRLTLNPIVHIDLFGSIIVPIITAIIPPHMTFGWAKPVPVNPYNFKNQRWGEFLVAAAGPASNLAIAVIFGTVLRFQNVYYHLSDSFLKMTLTLVVINLILAIFNLVPVPPLDGSKILYGLLPRRYIFVRDFLDRYSIAIFLFFIFFVWEFVDPLVVYILKLIIGA